MITYQTEKLAAFFLDAKELFPEHYEELSLNKTLAKQKLDIPRYEHLEENKALHIATARDDGKIIGYFVSFLMPHLHYADAGVMGYCDMYFLQKAYRKGGIGARLLCFVEKCMRELGAVKLYWSHKVHQDHSKLFAALGFAPSDIMHTKVLS